MVMEMLTLSKSLQEFLGEGTTTPNPLPFVLAEFILPVVMLVQVS